jgi:glycerophosphoryl diester phosphodiesterase
MKTIFVALILLSHNTIYAVEPLIVAHRGASRDAPENTIPAFKQAWEQGADAIEGDFHLTQDGHIVCIHDDNTKRVSKTNMVVRNSTLAELRALDVGSHHDDGFKGITIPTLLEVFSTIPEQKTIYIEIKCGPEIIPALLADIKKWRHKKEQIVLICFDKKVLQELKSKVPQYKTYWLCSFKKNKDRGTRPSLQTVMETLELIDADGLSSNIDIPEAFIGAIGKKGYEWHVWTIDDLKALGAKSVTTNMPRFIRDHLFGQELGGQSAIRPELK